MRKRNNRKPQLKRGLAFELEDFDPIKQEARLQHLRMLRQKAYKTMQLLKDFSPKLTGMVLDGSATFHTHIRLHAFASKPEEVIIFLVNHRIPYDESEQRVLLMDKRFISFPMFYFYLAETAIEITVFPEDSPKYFTRCPTTGERMPRAGLDEVGALMI